MITSPLMEEKLFICLTVGCLKVTGILSITTIPNAVKLKNLRNLVIKKYRYILCSGSRLNVALT